MQLKDWEIVQNKEIIFCFIWLYLKISIYKFWLILLKLVLNWITSHTYNLINLFQVHSTAQSIITCFSQCFCLKKKRYYILPLDLIKTMKFMLYVAVCRCMRLFEIISLCTNCISRSVIAVLNTQVFSWVNRKKVDEHVVIETLPDCPVIYIH